MCSIDRDIITRFIEKYKQHSCLWDTTHLDYMNKLKRLAALQNIRPILGEEATIDSVRKRIDTLRNGYLREYKKVKASIAEASSEDDVYIPTLWYYDLMSFLTFDLPEDDFKVCKQEVTEYGESSNRARKNKLQSERKEVLLKKNRTEDKPAGHDETFSSYINHQLQKLSNNQRILAEKLMSDILYLARTHQLHESTHIVTESSPQPEYLENSPLYIYTPSPLNEDHVS